MTLTEFLGQTLLCSFKQTLLHTVEHEQTCQYSPTMVLLSWQLCPCPTVQLKAYQALLLFILLKLWLCTSCSDD